MEDKEITKARDNFMKAIKRLTEKYREKGVKIKSVEIEWEDLK